VKKKRTKKVVFNLLGGIGNQLFIYFAGQYFEQESGRTVVYEKFRISSKDSQHKSDIEDLNLALPLITSQDARFFPKCRPYLRMRFYKLGRRFSQEIYFSDVFGFDPDFIPSLNVNRVHGYFQTYKYYESTTQRKILEISMKNPTHELLSELQTMKVVKPISVHIRRGDYRNNPEFGLLSRDYYVNSVQLAERLLGESQLWVFSDDLEAAEELMNFISPERVKIMRSSLSDTESFVLMSQSPALIMANSTFSYWAGIIGNQSKLVISPSKWFRYFDDPKFLYPEHWLQSTSFWEDAEKIP
jgi:hypothetical protein